MDAHRSRFCQPHPILDSGVFLGAKALFWPTDSIMHVVGFNNHPRKYFQHSNLVEVKLSKSSLEDIISGIAKSFTMESKSPKALGKGLYGHSYFYEGKGTFYLGRTCNHWTAEILKASGIPIRTIFLFSSGQVMNELDFANQTYVCCKPTKTGDSS